MSIPKNKEELIHAIEDSYSRLISELESIPIELTKKNEIEGHAKGTTMSFSDLVSYLIGWGELVLKWNDRKERGLEVEFPESGFKWNELGKLAQKFYKDYEKDDFKNLLKKLEISTNNIIEVINLKSNFELYEVAWYEKWTLGKMIQLNTSSPFKNAKARIRKWKKNYDSSFIS